jgi:hypothetical protein
MQHESLADALGHDHLGDPGEIVALDPGVDHDETDVVEGKEVWNAEWSRVRGPAPVRDGVCSLG